MVDLAEYKKFGTAAWTIKDMLNDTSGKITPKRYFFYQYLKWKRFLNHTKMTPEDTQNDILYDSLLWTMLM